jgi:hypothetical protein
MNHIKQICKDPVKVEQKLQGKEFLLGKYFNLKSDYIRCNKHKKFPCKNLSYSHSLQTTTNSSNSAPAQSITPQLKTTNIN